MCVGYFDAKFCKRSPEDSVFGIHFRKCDTCYRSRQCKRKLNTAIEDTFSRNSYLTSTQAMITPNTLFISAAINEHPMLVANACRTVGFVIRDQNSAGRSFNAETITDASGISTIRETLSL